MWRLHLLQHGIHHLEDILVSVRDNCKAKREVHLLKFFLSQLLSQQLLQALGPRAGVRPDGDRTVPHDDFSFTVDQGPCPQVDQHLPGLRRAEVELRVGPGPAVLVLLLLDVGARRALFEVVEHCRDAVHPLLATVHIVTLHDLLPLLLARPTEDAAALRCEKDRQIPHDPFQHLAVLVRGDDDCRVGARRQGLQALAQLHRQPRSERRSPARMHAFSLLVGHQTLQEVHDDKSALRLRPLREELLVGQERRHLGGHLDKIRAGLLQAL
mmetsp:Transcript_4649/g.7438  ORF Transcript_4649/g.7438 Transcript_4649/m.7438 type:complete len:269 (-) Transcript_4649:1747-2553(-)